MHNPYYKDNNFSLYLRDSLSLMRDMPEKSVDMIYADPPYMLSNGGITCQGGKMVSVNKGSWDQSGGLEADRNFHEDWISGCRRILKDNGTMWVSGTYHNIYLCGYVLQEYGFHIINDITWFKPNASPNLGCRCFTASHESLIWVKKSKKAKHTFNYQAMKEGNFDGDFIKKPGKQMRSVWSIPSPPPSEKVQGRHPTQKPLSLLRRIIASSTEEGNIIFDPFNGSGTTGIAALQVGGREYIGCDKDRSFLDLTIRRQVEEKDKQSIMEV